MLYVINSIPLWGQKCDLNYSNSFQRNVTYTVHCNRYVLSAVNFHNRHTDDDGCTVETC